MSKSYWLKDEDQKGNFSNQKKDTFDAQNRYMGIRLQQGVPLLDRDWNELEDIRRYAEVMLRKYYIGNGVPDENSFKITPVDMPANDFKIAAGRCLVEGFEVVNEPVDAEGNMVDFILYLQQEGISPLSVPETDRTDTVYLDVWIEEVSGAKEPALKNPQDVNMETCIRHKLCWHVQVDEGSQGYQKEPFHHYYDIAHIHRKAGKNTIEATDIEDLRSTGLALHLLTDQSNADNKHTHSKLTTQDSHDPALVVDSDGNIKLKDGVAINKFSNDANFSYGSESAVPTEKAVKEYFDKLSTLISEKQGFLSTLPVGSIVAWHRDLVGPDGYTPELPPGWVPCNGQVLDDLESPFHGFKIPNLNAEGRFLRGAESSGQLQEDQMQSHKHDEPQPGHKHQVGCDAHGQPPGGFGDYVDDYGTDNILTRATSPHPVQLGDPTNSETGAGEPRHGNETRPVNMSVVWIIKVKEVMTTNVQPAVLAHLNAPQGTVYVSEKGNVGIGTTEPQNKLQITGGSSGAAASILNPSDNYNKLILENNDHMRINMVTPNNRHGGMVFSDPDGFERGMVRYRHEVDKMDFKVDGTFEMTIAPGGNVGIGTENPGAKLEIVADSTWQTYYEAIRLGPASQSGITHPGSKLGLSFWGTSKYRGLYVRDFESQNDIMILDAREGGTLWVRATGVVGRDYAENFESKDGKEIKAGTAVVLDNGKIRPAMKNETPIGIISANPGMAGGVHVEWPKKYLRDEFGNQVMEEYKEEIIVPKKEKVKKERQKMKKETVKEKVIRTKVIKIKGKYCQEEIIETVDREIEEPVFTEVDLYDATGKNKIGKHKVPVMETYEEEIDVLDDKGQPVMVGSGKFEIKTKPKINPEYDETQEYIPREKRPEWNCVGLLGQLPLRKGQPTAPTWIKIKDISKDVELWLVK